MWAQVVAWWARRREPSSEQPNDAHTGAQRARELRRAAEPLEGRIAPASLINASTLQFTDIDGDFVTVKFSKSLFTQTGAALESTLAGVFKFSTGVAHTGSEPQQLQKIDLTQIPLVGGKPAAEGVSFTITSAQDLNVQEDMRGDGFAHIGAIRANFALGSITIDGDLGQIDAGNAASKTGIKSLTVQSLGAVANTQLVDAGETDAQRLESRIVGQLAKFTALGDVSGYLHAVDGLTTVGTTPTVTAPGSFGSITILGSLKGVAAVAATSDNTGTIDSMNEIGAVKIGDSLAEGIVGGGGKNSGSIVATGKISSITVSGSVVGGGGENSGAVQAGADLGTTKIAGSLEGGAGTSSGRIRATGKISSVTIGDDVRGGDGNGSGTISSIGDLGAVKITNDLVGGGKVGTTDSGSILTDGKLKSLTVGSIQGGIAVRGGYVDALGTIGSISVRTDITGGEGELSGSITAGERMSSVTIGGKLMGGDGFGSGSISAAIDADLVKILVTGGVVGGDGDKSGSISAGQILSATLGKVRGGILPMLSGGEGDYSGTLSATHGMGSIVINGAIVGAVGGHSGAIETGGRLKSLTVSGALTGADGDFSASIQAFDDLERQVAGTLSKITILGSLTGSTGERSTSFHSDGTIGTLTIGAFTGGQGIESGFLSSGTGTLAHGDVQKVSIKGALADVTMDIGGKLGGMTVNGALTDSTVRAGDDIKTLSVAGDLINSTIQARGQLKPGRTSDIAIGTLTVSGKVENSDVLAGYLGNGFAFNPAAQIGNIRVNGDWIASNIVAGIEDADANGFGTAGDVVVEGENPNQIVSHIASITIGGTVRGSDATGDHFGFVAQKIGSVRIAGTATTLNANSDDVVELDLTNGDTTLREI